MKKLLLILVLFLFPMMVLATVENYHMNVTVLKNGDMEVEEYFSLDGEFNGVPRTINFKNPYSTVFNPDDTEYPSSLIHNGTNIIIEKIAAVKKSANYDFSNFNGYEFKKVDSANKGDYGVYTESSSGIGVDLKIFLPSSKNEAFYIKYKIENVAVLHDDVGELMWKIFDNNSPEAISDLQVVINLPGNINTTKVWSHGPDDSYTEIISNNQVKLTAPYLPSYTAIDVRAAFDKEVISDSPKKTNVAALDKIVAYETRLAEEANRRREEEDKFNESMILEFQEEFKKTSSRDIYNQIETRVHRFHNPDKITEYTKFLEEAKPRVDEFEYEQFNRIVVGALDSDYAIYDDVLSANKNIDNVFDVELRAKMRNDLENVVAIVKKTELKNNLSYVLIGAFSVCLAYIYKRFLKYMSERRKSYDKELYLRELPSDLSPSAVGLLIDKRLSSDEVSATILSLINRKILEAKKLEDGTFELSKNYGAITKGNGMTSEEVELIEMVFGTKEVIKAKKAGKIDYDDYISWRKKILKELKNKNYIKSENVDNGALGIAKLILLIVYMVSSFRLAFAIISFTLGSLIFPIIAITLAIVIAFLLIIKYFEKIFWYLLILINIIFIVVSIGMNHYINFVWIFGIIYIIIIGRLIKKVPKPINIRLTKEGKEELAKWKAFKSFLVDFSRLDMRDVDEVVLWEKYLVYATALGISKKVLDQIKVKIEQINIDQDLSDVIIYSNMDSLFSFGNSVSKGISSSILSHTLESMNSGGSSGGGWSSGGGGGGFSSGGSSSSSGGGGGSIGRF